MEILLAIVIVAVVAVLFFSSKGTDPAAVEANPARVSRSEGVQTSQPGETHDRAFAVTQLISEIPQDSVLRRHYQSHLQHMIETLAAPSPSDSVLRRHYDHYIGAELEACLEDANKRMGLISRYDRCKGETLAFA